MTSIQQDAIVVEGFVEGLVFFIIISSVCSFNIIVFLHRVIFGIPEIMWNVIGSVWILTGQIECEPDTALPILMKGNCYSYKYIGAVKNNF